MQLSNYTTTGSLTQLVLKDIVYSQNLSSKIFPTFMQKTHYSVLLSWLFEHSDELLLHRQTQFRGKQILDIFLAGVGNLDTHSYQLAAAVCIRLAMKSVEDKDYPITELIHNTGDQYSIEQATLMESHIMTEIAPKFEGLHSPYSYCSDELVMHLLTLKLNDAFQLMIPFVATHANSFGVNSLSMFLAVVRKLAASQGGQEVVMAQLSSSLCESVIQDCDNIAKILQELDEFGQGLPDAHDLK